MGRWVSTFHWWKSQWALPTPTDRPSSPLWVRPAYICALRSGIDNASLKYVEYNICNVQTCHQSISNFKIYHIITKAWWFRGVSRMAHGLHLPQGSGWTPTKIRQQKNKHNITQPSFVSNSGSKFPMRLTNQRKTRKVTPWAPPGGSMAKVAIRLWTSSLCSKIW